MERSRWARAIGTVRPMGTAVGMELSVNANETETLVFNGMTFHRH